MKFPIILILILSIAHGIQIKKMLISSIQYKLEHILKGNWQTRVNSGHCHLRAYITELKELK